MLIINKHFNFCCFRALASFFLYSIGQNTLPSHASAQPASQAGPMRNPKDGTSVVQRDTIRLA